MNDGKQVARGEQRAMVILLMTMTLLGVFPLDVVLPSFPDLSDYFRTSPSDIALSVSVFAIGLALSVVLVGPLSDLWGRKKLLLAGIAIAVVGATGCVVSSEYSWFLFFRVIQAVGCGSFVLSQALVQDLFVGKEQERIRIWMVTGGGVFISISPLLGTWLQLQLGWQGSFYVFISLAVIVWLKAFFLLRENPHLHTTAPERFFSAYWRLCSDFRFMGYWLISALAFACHFSFIVISPIIFMERLALSPYAFAWALLLYGVAYVFGGIVASALHRYLQANTQIVIGLGLIALSGLVMLWLAEQFGLSAAAVLIPMLICTAGTTIARPIANSKAMSLYPRNAGTSTSVGGVLIFMCGGVISVVINLASEDLTTALALCFLSLSATGLGLNVLITRRHLALKAG
ncbi:MAG: MFS transporter [Gammaproteobacteria bacterium]|jgi:DHA1 family bicyclomycin/chloramphenicol resistance-like MFS transporter|nr:MFS transporter [Gammaproteobacteria bacterium]MBU0820161.1 MFS transporter [Gammaproteobacteria bacterium]MBU0843419.1 MFS transporter [Gammaproteobacteria bacterium]MBU1841397.1 MFS transporter [Gammaproteobacteria bacterium]